MESAAPRSELVLDAVDTGRTVAAVPCTSVDSVRYLYLTFSGEPECEERERTGEVLEAAVVSVNGGLLVLDPAERGDLLVDSRPVTTAAFLAPGSRLLLAGSAAEWVLRRRDLREAAAPPGACRGCNTSGFEARQTWWCDCGSRFHERCVPVPPACPDCRVSIEGTCAFCSQPLEEVPGRCAHCQKLFHATCLARRKACPVCRHETGRAEP